jgi:hypothetical protein
MGEIRNATKILVGNLEGNKTLGRPNYRWALYLNQQFRDMVKVELKRVPQTAYKRFVFSKSSPLRGTYFP